MIQVQINLQVCESHYCHPKALAMIESIPMILVKITNHIIHIYDLWSTSTLKKGNYIHYSGKKLQQISQPDYVFLYINQY